MKKSKLFKLCCLVVAFSFIVTNNAFALTNIRIQAARTNLRFLNRAFGLGEIQTLIELVDQGLKNDLMQASQDLSELEEILKQRPDTSAQSGSASAFARV